jgi:hypothetical protein
VETFEGVEGMTDEGYGNAEFGRAVMMQCRLLEALKMVTGTKPLDAKELKKLQKFVSDVGLLGE